MKTIALYSIITGVITVLLIASGFWLRKKQEPYPLVISAIHKLGAVAVVVFLVLIIRNHLHIPDFRGLGLIFLIVSCLFFITAFISGILITIEKIQWYFLKTIHKITSFLTVIMIPVIWIYCH